MKKIKNGRTNSLGNGRWMINEAMVGDFVSFGFKHIQMNT